MIPKLLNYKGAVYGQVALGMTINLVEQKRTVNNFRPSKYSISGLRVGL